MKYRLQSYSILEYGKRVDALGNPHQEDSIYPQHKQSTPLDRLYIVCDGMGGHDAGEVASATVCNAISASIAAMQGADVAFTDDMLAKAVSDAYDALDKVDTGAEKKMGTTLTLLKFHENGCTIAHMGDSRVYHIRPGRNAADTEILFQTQDHSLVNDLIRIGEMTPEEAKHSRQKNVITRAMQPNGKRLKADIYHTADIRQGDYFYLCTDGMLEQMEDHNIRYNFSDAAGDDNQKIATLVRATAENKDNHSAYIVHVLGVEGKAVAQPNAPKVECGLPLNRTHNYQKEMYQKTLKVLLALIIATLIVVIGAYLSYTFFSKVDAKKAAKAKTEQVEKKTAPTHQ